MIGALLALTDVTATGYHAAVSAGVTEGMTVAVVGDGAVDLSGVLASTLLGAERIIVLGSTHEDRHALAREWGATDIIDVRGDEAVERLKDLTDGFGADLAHIAEAYAAMDERRAIKALVKVSDLTRRTA